MNADIFAEWLRRQGYHVVRTASSYWYNVNRLFYQAFPYHWQITPTTREIQQLFRQHRMIGVRYSGPATASAGAPSYHMVFDEPQLLLADLRKKARYDVRKGLEFVQIETISMERLAQDGWRLREETLARQGRQQAEDQTWWEKMCRAGINLAGIEAWGALYDDQLVAALFTLMCDDTFYILHHQSATDYLQHRVNNALVFEVVNGVLSDRPSIRTIFYGLESLDAPASVDDFKLRMNFQKIPVTQHVAFHPWIAPFMGRAALGGVQMFNRLLPDSPTLSKLEGILRVYMDGNNV